LTHHVTNALMVEALEQVMTVSNAPSQNAAFVQHAVASARRLAKAARKSDGQERPTTNAQVAEGRQWLERVRRSLPEEARELLVWRLVEGIPGPELVEVLSLEERTARASIERGLAETVVPAQSFVGSHYAWDLSGEPTPQLARVETYAMALRFDPLAKPEHADVVYTAATFQDLNDAKVGEVRPGANPFGDSARTQVHSEPKARAPAVTDFTDEKTQGAYDLPAAAREVQPRTEVQTPVLRAKPPPASRPATFKSEPKVAPVVDDERPSRRRMLEERRNQDVGRRETREAPLETVPMAPLVDDERPSRSKLHVKSKALEEALAKRRPPELGPEEPSARKQRVDPGLDEGAARRRSAEAGFEDQSGRRRNPEESARRRNPELAEESARRKNPELARPRSSSEPQPLPGASQPSLEATDPEGPKKPAVITERYLPQPVNPLVRIGVVAAIAFVLLLAIAWRLGLF
jgi:hypothetical protein